jgi:hypothetical protein
VPVVADGLCVPPGGGRAVGPRRHHVSAAPGDLGSRHPSASSIGHLGPFNELLARQRPQEQSRDPGDVGRAHVDGPRSGRRSKKGRVRS